METQQSTSVADSNPSTMQLGDLKAQIEAIAAQPQEPIVPLSVVMQEEPKTETATQTTPEPAPEQGKAEEPKKESLVDGEIVTKFDDLQKKAGFKNPDDLAKSYTNLRKKLNEQAQELANLKKQEVRQEVPLNSQDEILAKRIQEVGTVQALKELNEAMNKPVYEKIKEDTLRAKIHELQSKPETAEFNLPEIQKEIQKIVTERPQQFADNEGMIYPDALEDLYYMAKGRVGLINAGIKPQSERQTIAPIEGRTKSNVVQQSFNPQTMNLGKLRELIESQTQ